MDITDLYDKILNHIELDNLHHGLSMLVGILDAARLDYASFPDARRKLRSHELHRMLLEDPFTALSFSKPLRYPAHPRLLDLLYDQEPPNRTSSLGHQIFDFSINLPALKIIGKRRDQAERFLLESVQSQEAICVLDCGHLREANKLIGERSLDITAVDSNPASLSVAMSHHREGVTLIHNSASRFLQNAYDKRQSYDLIYSLSLVDRLNEATLPIVLQSMRRCLTPKGKIFIAVSNFRTLGLGWMDICLDWRPFCSSFIEIDRIAALCSLSARSIGGGIGSTDWYELTSL